MNDVRVHVQHRGVLHGAGGGGTIGGQDGVSLLGMADALSLRWVAEERKVLGATATDNLNEPQAHCGTGRTRETGAIGAAENCLFGPSKYGWPTLYLRARVMIKVW